MNKLSLSWNKTRTDPFREIPATDEAQFTAAGRNATFNRAVSTTDEAGSTFCKAVLTMAKPPSTSVKPLSTGDK
jgi:hypothetical protein